MFIHQMIYTKPHYIHDFSWYVLQNNNAYSIARTLRLFETNPQR